MARMITRRRMLTSAPLAALPLVVGRSAAQPPRTAEPGSTGMIVRMQEPRNLETPPEGLIPWKTQTEQFYIRSHFAVPKLNSDTFRLTVVGHVEKPLDLTLADLIAIAKSSKPMTLECAGNGRVFLAPAAPGLQWGLGGVGNAEWTGVPLGAVLERAKVKAGAVDVILSGADKGAITSLPSSPGPIAFDRSIPLEKAKRDECLLATHMNGDPLTASHGSPLRAVIGGWYGVASVKWLTKIIVTDTPYNGFWQSLDYSKWVRKADAPSLVPLTTVQPKAIILKPVLNATIPAGREFTITGKAWAGERSVAKVNVSVDGGKSWATAKVADDEKLYCWRNWQFNWRQPAAGSVALLARCTDDRGNTQLLERDPDRRSYEINHLIPVEVTVK